MPCLALPAPPIPQLPPGITIPIFSPPSLPNLGFCCKLPSISFPIPAIAISIAFPSAIVTALNGYLTALQSYFDALSVNCPLQ